LFERFYRGEDTRGRGRPGAGLGLAISRAIVDQHGGTITAARNEPQGCVVTVVLPVGELAATVGNARVPA
jgi:signal transduction histidine kinase